MGTSASGQHSFEGTFSKVVDQSKVVLIDDRGKELQVPLSNPGFYDIYFAVLNDLAANGDGFAVQFPVTDD